MQIKKEKIKNKEELKDTGESKENIENIESDKQSQNTQNIEGEAIIDEDNKDTDESVIKEDIKVTPEKENTEKVDNKEKESRDYRHKVELSLSSLIKKAVESGINVISNPEKGLKGIVHDFSLPKEIGNYVFDQIDETKHAVLKVAAREIREFLEHTDIADTLTKVLTSVSFEVKTEVKFKSNLQNENKENLKK